jgi:ATPase subunit of ABC transporter with duplicated ATPase domains
VKYDEYVTLRKESREQQLRAYENQQKEIADMCQFFERYRYQATKAVHVQLKIKQLENADKTLLSCQRYAQYGFSKEPLSTVYLALDDVFDSCVLLF